MVHAPEEPACSTSGDVLGLGGAGRRASGVHVGAVIAIASEEAHFELLPCEKGDSKGGEVGRKGFGCSGPDGLISSKRTGTNGLLSTTASYYDAKDGF